MISILFPVLVCASCNTNPLTTEVIGLPATASSKREVTFKVIVRNESRKTQILPTDYEVTFTTSIRFIPAALPGKLISEMRASGKMLSGDYAITRNSISICPPQFVYLKSGESRIYDLKWTPVKNDRGTGALSIELPYSFPEIPLQPMTIQEPQGAAGQSASRAVVKF